MTKHISDPLMILWFGNFYQPAYDDRAFIDESMARIRAMGFNAVMLDSKAWEDFHARFEGGEASAYVSQQEYMMLAAAKAALGHMFLALYLNGDNLYPNIRFSPPIHGDSVVLPDGSDGRWYRYWSEKAHQAQETHVRGLMGCYREGHASFTQDGQERLPVCSMWDPIVAPSFDKEGQTRYRNWLWQRYGDIGSFNSAYQTSFGSFDEPTPFDYWFTVRYGENACYTLNDLRQNTPAFVMWADNMCWRSDELTTYFAAMNKRLHGIDPALYLMPNMAQWSHLLNIDTSRKQDVGLCELWDTAMRGIEMRRLAPHVDMCHYYTLPVTIDGDPDAYVVAVQHAHIRSLNKARPFLGGVYWGRFLYNDIYRYITPEEVVGEIVASGASGIASYGFCGMDDGGLLHRMDDGFCDSLTRANQWAKSVIPKLGKRKQSHVAILYPTAMALLEPLKVEGSDKRRMDLLGLYRCLCDAGFAPDIVEAEEVTNGLDGYDVLLIPANDCYHAQRDFAMEQALRSWVRAGGTVVHGQWAETAEMTFDLNPKATESGCFTYEGEGGLPQGGPYAVYPGKSLAFWRENGTSAISVNRFGQGQVYSFGYLAGYPYAARTAPHVPLSQRNAELYPVPLMRHDPLRDVVLRHASPDAPVVMKDVTCTAFDHGYIIVNHRSTPIKLPDGLGAAHHQQDADSLLPGHSAVWLEKESLS